MKNYSHAHLVASNRTGIAQLTFSNSGVRLGRVSGRFLSGFMPFIGLHLPKNAQTISYLPMACNPVVLKKIYCSP